MDWKTYFTDGLVQIAVLLSLFRTDWNNYLNSSLYDGYPEINEILMGPVSAYTQSIYAPEWHSSSIGISHPKALSIDHRSSIFRDIHQLANYQRFHPVSRDINAYLVNGPVSVRNPSENAHTSQGHAAQEPQSGDANNNNSSQSANDPSPNVDAQRPEVEGAVGPDNPQSWVDLFSFPDGELSKEDLDLIEILWRQDIDLGAPRDSYDLNLRKQQEKEVEAELQQQREKEKELEKKLAEDQSNQNTSNVSYIVDQETGELVPAPLQSQPLPAPPAAEHVPFTSLAQEQLLPTQPIIPTEPQPDPQQQQDAISIEDAMRLLEESSEDFAFVAESETQSHSVQQGLDELEAMIENVTQNYEQQQQPAFQRQSSIEQRWQDISMMLATPTNDTSFDPAPLLQNTSLLQNASFAAPAPNMSALIEGLQPVYQPQAVPLTPVNLPQGHLLPTSALGLTDTTLTGQGGQFVNSSDSLLQHLLHDNLDLDLPDMNVTNITESMETNDLSSDSAISSASSIISSIGHQALSSIGSPTQDLSDFRSNISSPYDALEGATGGNHDDDSSSYREGETKYKFEPDGSFSDSAYGTSSSGRRLYSNSSEGSNSTEYGDSPADPNKVGHNHTYPLQPGQEPKIHKKAMKQELDTTDIQYSRDQKRAKAMNIPFTMEEMITSTVEHFAEMLQSRTLTDAQLQLIRDIRRRGKNKVAAQNCRKRKLEVIQNLEDEVNDMRRDRDQLQKERKSMDEDLSQMKAKFSAMYQEVFRSLRDEHNRPYDPSEYSLQQTDDGEMLLVPHNATSVIGDDPKTKPSRKRKGEPKH